MLMPRVGASYERCGKASGLKN